MRRIACFVMGLWLAPGLVAAQTTSQPPDDAPNQEDPTRAVFFSVRNQYFNLKDSAWNNALILRTDRAMVPARPRVGKVGVLTRLDLPVTTMSFGETTRTGLGDIYVQALYVPFLGSRFALAAGSGLTFPTATDTTLGAGKWQLVPTLVPLWFFPDRKGFFVIRLQEHVAFAGDADRPDVNFLEVVPLAVWNIRSRWWITTDTNASIDWRGDNVVSFRSGVEVGRVIGRRWGVSLKPEIPWGAHRQGDFKLTTLVTRYRRR